MNDAPKPFGALAPDIETILSRIPQRTDEEIAAHEKEVAAAALNKRLDDFLDTIPEEYRETTDIRRTPFGALPSLFAANAGAGALTFPVNEAAFRAAMKASPSLYLYGDTGTGKTRAALRRAFYGLQLGEWTGVRVARFSDVTAKYSAGIAPELPFDPGTRRLLILDDFLNGKPIGARKEAFAGELLTLIEARLMNNLPTIFTANAEPVRVCAWFDACGVDAPSVVRRIAQKSAVIPF